MDFLKDPSDDSNNFVYFLVRSKKDKDVLMHLLENFWMFTKIETIKEKSLNGLIKQLSSYPKKPIFLFLSKNDHDLFEHEKLKQFLIENHYNNVFLIDIQKAKLRNERLNVLFNKIQNAFKLFLNRFNLIEFQFSPILTGYDVNEDIFIPPLFYLFLIYFKTKSSFNFDLCKSSLSNYDSSNDQLLGFINFLENNASIIGLKNKNILNFYSESELIFTLDFQDINFSMNSFKCFYDLIVSNLKDNSSKKRIKKSQTSDLFFHYDHLYELFINYIDSHLLFKSNKNIEFLDFLIQHSKDFILHVLLKFQPNNIVIPFSGGKDSLALLLLINDVIFELNNLNYNTNHIRVIPIYVKTSYEFHEVENYVNKIENILNLKIIRVFVDFSNLTVDDFKARKCTELKVKALYNEIEKLNGKSLVVIGNRAGESFARRKRGWIWKDNWLFIAPIFFWNYLTLQYFIYFKHKLFLNPLYDFGLYRTGCYNCPFISKFEKIIVKMLGYEF